MMKKTMSIAAAMCITSAILPGPALAQELAEVGTYAELAYYSSKPEGYSIRLTSNIEAPEGSKWSPLKIGAGCIFDGNGYTVSNLTYTAVNEGYIGFISENKGTVRNLTIKDPKISGTNYTGGIVAYNHDEGLIEDCECTETVIGTAYSAEQANDEGQQTYEASNSVGIGGIVGYNNLGTIRRCVNRTEIGKEDSNKTFVGGIAGCNNGGTIEQCSNYGKVSGAVSIGGIVGGNIASAGRVNNCFNMGQISGVSNVGGIVGNNLAGNVLNSYSNVKITNNTTMGNGPVVGCVVNGMVENCYYDSTVQESNDVSFGIAKTTDGFISGEAAYLLNRNTPYGVWLQTLESYNTVLGKSYPSFDGLTVFSSNELPNQPIPYFNQGYKNTIYKTFGIDENKNEVYSDKSYATIVKSVVIPATDKSVKDITWSCRGAYIKDADNTTAMVTSDNTELSGNSVMVFGMVFPYLLEESDISTSLSNAAE